MKPTSVARKVERAVRTAIAGRPAVLAVSGGRDSMALLHAASRSGRKRVACVATFDHGTGAAATRAVELVAEEAARLGFPVVIGRAESPGETESAWRAARHSFLSDVAARFGAVIATAHTRDDQVETVLMRVLRGSGARGLAGLYARNDRYVRPLVELSREEVAAYATAVDARWIDDPTNASPRFLRNRLRRDLLPALHATAPRLAADLLTHARDAATVRHRVEAIAARMGRVRDGALTVDARDLEGLGAEELATLWPAIAARVGVAMDWRGTRRVAAFTKEARSGSRIPLSGGWEIRRALNTFEMWRPETRAIPLRRALESGVRVDRWRFVATSGPCRVSDEWVAQLPVHRPLSIRPWLAGDRMRWGDRGMRKVKRFLSDARISGTSREQWPVVLAGDEIIWIPGVRRSDAAAVRPGRPGVLYRCELDGR